MRVLIIPVLILAVVISGCTGANQAASPPEKSSSQILKGVSLSPKSFSPSDFSDFFAKAKEAGNAVMWAGDWNELGNSKGAPEVVMELSKQYGYTPIIEAQFFSQSTGKLTMPLDNATKEMYLKAAGDFAGKYKPAYMGFGIEVNTLYEKSPQDFGRFVEFYSEVYDAVKAKSPDTKVFTVFQLEKMKGGGGLFGASNSPEWQLPGMFPKSDMVAFTTYPGLIYKNPSDIPSDYYTSITSYVSKPVAFTEIGWHSAPSPAGWESSDSEQSEFVERFFNLTNGVDKKIVIWSFLYDPETAKPFDSMGLISRSGVEKPAWTAWTKK